LFQKTQIPCFTDQMILNFDPQFVVASKIVGKIVNLSSKEDISDVHYCDTKGIVVRLGTNLDGSFLSRFKQLTFVATITTGTDHIDEDYCKIQVISLKGEVDFLGEIHATPEHNWCLLLSLIRNIPWAFQSVCAGNWVRQGFFGHELYKKCLGIIGFGRVGKIISNYALAFGMDMIVYDREMIPKDKYQIRQVTLDSLLKTSDVISINLSLDETTRHFLREEHFNMMKRSAILINTSRGAIIDEKALLYALEQKQIAGAAIDVLADEHIDSVISNSHPLIAYAKRHQNLLITPHIAGSTYDSMEKTSLFIADKIENFLRAREE